MKNILISFALLVFGSSDALADVVTKCNSPKGYSYYAANSSLPGWTEDGISKGGYLVNRDSSGKYDVLFLDAVDRARSSREDGGNVKVISKSNNHLVLVVTYPEEILETYYFRIDRSGAGELTVSQARYGKEQTNRHMLLRAACSK